MPMAKRSELGMMPVNQEYTVIEASSVDELINAVTAAAKEQWLVQGGICAYCEPEQHGIAGFRYTAQRTYLLQAMIRERR